MKSDPARWDAYLARLRANYVPTGTSRGPRPTRTTCSTDGCEEKHFALGFCRKHYRRDRYRRGLDRKAHTELVGALVKRYDADGQFIEEPQHRRLVTKIVGKLLIPECPACGGIMRKLPHDELDLRDCGDCRVRASLNVEEVSWLTSGTPSTVQSQPIRNS